MTDQPGVPELPAVVALLHRADWRRLSLSGQVRGRDESLGPESGDARRRVTLHIAPGGRYRRDLVRPPLPGPLPVRSGDEHPSTPPSAVAAKVAGSVAESAAQAAEDVRRQAGETIAVARNFLGSLGNRRRPS